MTAKWPDDVLDACREYLEAERLFDVAAERYNKANDVFQKAIRDKNGHLRRDCIRAALECNKNA